MHNVEFEKNIFIVDWMDQTIRKNKTFWAELPLAVFFNLGCCCLYLHLIHGPRQQKPSGRSWNTPFLGWWNCYNPLKMHSKGPRFPFLHPTLLKVSCYINVALVHDAVPSWSEAKSSLQQVSLDLGIEGRVRWRFWMLRDEQSRVQTQSGWKFGSPWWRNGWRGVGEKRHSPIDET